MDAKLTLKLNKGVIEKAKEYATKNSMSLSRLVEAYLRLLTSQEESPDYEISTFVKSIATGTEIPSDLDYKKEYSDHLAEKFK